MRQKIENKFMVVSVTTLQYKTKNLALDCIENYVYNCALSTLQITANSWLYKELVILDYVCKAEFHTSF